MFREGFDTYVENTRVLTVGQELQLEVRDCEAYRVKTVKAFVAPPGEKLADGQSLWVRSPLGYLFSEEPWQIRITEVLDER